MFSEASVHKGLGQHQDHKYREHEFESPRHEINKNDSEFRVQRFESSKPQAQPLDTSLPV